MGKLLFLLVLAAVAGIFLLPLGGTTAWQIAERRRLPHAVARAVAHGMAEAWSWVVTPTRSRGGDLARPPSRARARQIEVARAPEPQRSRAAQPAPGRAPVASPDGIVAEPPQESLSSGDRAALDRLVSTRR